ncbi:MAG: hypothetical protein IJ005_04950 [Bacteroidales bacterium]|nr:hypothetical protein [Bacteroidales bacterium]
MQNRNFIKLFSVLLTLWYIISIIGFDLHICGCSGEKYVSSFLTGISCEDIHPEHMQLHDCTDVDDCCSHHHKGHGHHEREQVADSPCCTDDYQVLLLTGERVDVSNKFSDSCHCGHCAFLPCMVHIPVQHSLSDIRSRKIVSDCGFFRPYDLLSSYGVRRI